MIKKLIRRILGKPEEEADPTKAMVFGPQEHGINPALVSNNAIRVTQTLQEAGFKAFLVGGAVRDLLLGIKPGTTFLGMDADTAKIATIILVGALMIIYVTVGGMKGTTYVQIVKSFMLMGGALIMTLLVLAHYKFNLSALLGDAAARSGKGGGGPSYRSCS